MIGKNGQNAARIVVLLATVLGATMVQAAMEDWPGWRGPGHDARVPGFVAPARWPEKLEKRWQLEVGEGHAGPVVAGSRAFAFARRGADETVTAISLADGKVLWQKSYPAPFIMHEAALGHGPGPKSTPVVADGRLFTLGIGGILSAWDAANGELLWRKEFGGRFKSTWPLFGSSASPTVEGSLLIVPIGGHDSGALAAFDVKTGSEAWSRPEEGPGYASPVVVEIGGVRQVLIQMQASMIGVALATGELLWRIPFETAYLQNIVTPLAIGDLVFYSGIDKGVTAIRPTKSGGKWTVEPVWHTDAASLYMSSPVAADGRVCGLSHKRKGQLFCLDAKTGKTIWVNEGRSGENAAVYGAADLLLVANERGELIVARSSGDAYAELARYELAASPTWSSPAISGKNLLIKDQKVVSLYALP